jgi:hypothetical protein
VTIQKELSPEHQALSHLLLHPAWEGIIKKGIAERAAAYNNQLIDPSVSRKDVAPDDFIRGYIAALKWVVSWPEEEMNRAVQTLLDEAAELAEPEAPLFGNIADVARGMTNGQGRPSDSSSGT